MKPYNVEFKDVHTSDIIFKNFMYFLAGIFIFFMIILGYQLLKEGWPALKHAGFGFFIGTKWDPVHDVYGALPIIWGNFYVAILALVISFPLSLGSAIFITEFLNVKLSNILTGTINLLATIPSVIYGLWGMYVLGPFLSKYVVPFLLRYFGFLPFFKGEYVGVGIINAVLVLSVMIIPIMCAFFVNSLRLVPFVYKEQLYTLGATRAEVIFNVTLPLSKSHIITGIFLAFGRAFGETMAVTMLIGNSSQFTVSLLESSNTIASKIANEYREAVNPLHFSAVNLLGFLFVILSFVIFSIYFLLSKKKVEIR